MRHHTFPSGGHAPQTRRRRHTGRLSLTAGLAGLLSLATFAELPTSDGVAPPKVAAAIPVKPAAETPPPSRAIYAWMMDPKPLLGADRSRLQTNASDAPVFRMAGAAPVRMIRPFARPAILAAASAPTPVVAPEREASRPAPAQNLAQIAPAPVPLPVPRPGIRTAEMPARVADAQAVTAPDAPRTRAPRNSRRNRMVATAAPAEDNRSFIEKLFGMPAASGPSYASLDTKVDLTPRRLSNPGPAPEATAQTAVYDISAQTVYMPDGQRLEAHSGLGAKLDDPRFVHVRMNGATPPGTYDLTEREALFHNVRAIRLNPVGGSGAIFGRAGLLAHTYMLGPNGDSNGCVSFKDYERFLQAFLRGEVKRLVVVAGTQKGSFPFGNRQIGFGASPDRAG
jgi:hypothetical protein